jgi:hypothetical protein
MQIKYYTGEKAGPRAQKITELFTEKFLKEMTANQRELIEKNNNLLEIFFINPLDDLKKIFESPDTSEQEKNILGHSTLLIEFACNPPDIFNNVQNKEGIGPPLQNCYLNIIKQKISIESLGLPVIFEEKVHSVSENTVTFLKNNVTPFIINVKRVPGVEQTQINKIWELQEKDSETDTPSLISLLPSELIEKILPAPIFRVEQIRSPILTHFEATIDQEIKRLEGKTKASDFSKQKAEDLKQAKESVMSIALRENRFMTFSELCDYRDGSNKSISEIAAEKEHEFYDGVVNIGKATFAFFSRKNDNYGKTATEINLANASKVAQEMTDIKDYQDWQKGYEDDYSLPWYKARQDF